MTKKAPASAGGRPTLRHPTIDGDRVYHQSPLGQVVCLNAFTGGDHGTASVVRGTNGCGTRNAATTCR
jgi:hypothetical protein